MSKLIICAIFLFSAGIHCVAGVQNSATQTKELQALKALESKQKSAKAAYQRKVRDAKLKTAYIDATNAFAYKTMMSPALGPKVKYPAALKLYRETLKTDPKNAEATKWTQQIEAIYKSMGKPIPH